MEHSLSAHLFLSSTCTTPMSRPHPRSMSNLLRTGLTSQLCLTSRRPRSKLMTRYGRLTYVPAIHYHLPLIEEPMPPDYELQSYWHTRFEKERHFEWLGNGADTILPHVRTYLCDSQTSARSSPTQPARLLHIGAGTSSLPERIRELYHDVYGAEVDERAIVHTDFAANLVARQQEKEAALAVGGPRKGMRWICADAMKWGELHAALDMDGEHITFDLVVDKSTSDAISCGDDVSYSSPDPGLHPAINKYLATHEGRTMTFVPVEVLAVHLASLVRPGGLWVALSYSSNRFSFLSSPEPPDATLPRAANYWVIENVIAVDAPTGMKENGHAPVVQHYIFLLRRRKA